MMTNPRARARLQTANGKKGAVSKSDPASTGPAIMAADSTDDIMPSTSPLLSPPAIPATWLETVTRRRDWLKTLRTIPETRKKREGTISRARAFERKGGSWGQVFNLAVSSVPSAAYGKNCPADVVVS
jgi:hypothetical protein